MHRWDKQTRMTGKPQTAPEKEMQKTEKKKVWTDMHITWGEDTCSPAPSLVSPAALAQRSRGWPAEMCLPICGKRWCESVHLARSIAFQLELTACEAKWASLQTTTGQPSPPNEEWYWWSLPTRLQPVVFTCFSLLTTLCLCLLMQQIYILAAGSQSFQCAVKFSRK